MSNGNVEDQTPSHDKIKRMVDCINDWQGTEKFIITFEENADIIHYLLRNKDQMEVLLAIDPVTQKEFFNAFLVSIAKKSNPSYKNELLTKRLSDWTCRSVTDAYKARMLRYFVNFHNEAEIDTVLSLDPISQKGLYNVYLLEIAQTMPSGY